ncbi:MAG: hypothetical protein IPN71_09345 [Fibrobacteres bacterium]|nr:hypothetical protein [Fibrobacterota bacterium]
MSELIKMAARRFHELAMTAGSSAGLSGAFLAIFVFAALGCRSDAPKSVSTTPTTTSMPTSEPERPKASATDLSEGRRIHSQKCGACHVPYGRDSRSPGQWESVMRRMGPKAGLDTLQHRRVLDWLVQGDSLASR